jgi:predicted Na+-dependent transporter
MNNLNNKTTNKTFGTFFTVLFLLFATFFIFKGKTFYWYGSFLILSLIFFLLLTFSKETLQPLNNAWYWIGVVIGKYSSMIIYVVIFYLLVSPIALIAKIFNRDILRLRHESYAESYWVKREKDSRSQKEYFKNQF